jgi:hypothetical protein
VAEYIKEKYPKHELKSLELLKQPLLFLTNHEETIYLVPSLCREASLPKDFTKNGKNLRQLREHIVSTPHLRVERILNLISKFSLGEKGKRDVSNIKDFGLELNQELC